VTSIPHTGQLAGDVAAAAARRGSQLMVGDVGSSDRWRSNPNSHGSALRGRRIRDLETEGAEMGGARVGEGCRSNPSHHGLPCEVRGRAGDADAAREREERQDGEEREILYLAPQFLPIRKPFRPRARLFQSEGIYFLSSFISIISTHSSGHGKRLKYPFLL
jgi:hypothetical protein